MERRKRGSPFKALAAQAITVFGLLGLIWIGTKFGLHNKIGEMLIAPLAPKPIASPR